MDLLKDLAKASGNDLASVVDDGIVAGDVDGYLDTGSNILNALLRFNIWWTSIKQDYSISGRVFHWKDFLCVRNLSKVPRRQPR